MRFKQFGLICLVMIVFTACSGAQSSAPLTATPGPSSPTPVLAEANAPKQDVATSGPPASPAPVSGLDVPPEVAGHEAEWPLANHDYANTRAAVGSSINASNVANLKIAWTSSLEGTGEWGGGTGN